MINVNEFFIFLDNLSHKMGIESLSHSEKRVMYCIYEMAVRYVGEEGGTCEVSVSAANFAVKHGMSKKIAHISLKGLVAKGLLKAVDYKRDFKPVKGGGYKKNKGQTYIIDLETFLVAPSVIKEEEKLLKMEGEKMIGNFCAEEKEYLNRNAVGQSRESVLGLLKVHLSMMGEDLRGDYVDLIPKISNMDDDDWSYFQSLLPFSETGFSFMDDEGGDDYDPTLH